jgi:hypothetical protein
MQAGTFTPDFGSGGMGLGRRRGAIRRIRKGRHGLCGAGSTFVTRLIGRTARRVSPARPTPGTVAISGTILLGSEASPERTRISDLQRLMSIFTTYPPILRDGNQQAGSQNDRFIHRRPQRHWGVLRGVHFRSTRTPS